WGWCGCGGGGYVPGTTHGHGQAAAKGSHGEDLMSQAEDEAEAEANIMGGMSSLNLGHEFWGVLQLALARISWSLEVLALSDPSALNSWVLDVPTQPMWARGAGDAPVGMALAAAAAAASSSDSSPPQTSLTPSPFYSFPALHTLKLHFSFSTHAATFLARLASVPAPFSTQLHTLHFRDTSEILSEHPRAYPSWRPGRLGSLGGKSELFEGGVGVLREVVRLPPGAVGSDEGRRPNHAHPTPPPPHSPPSNPPSPSNSIEPSISISSALSALSPTLPSSLLSLSILNIPLNDPESEWVQILLQEVMGTLGEVEAFRGRAVGCNVEGWGRGELVQDQGKGAKGHGDTTAEAKGGRSTLIASLMPLRELHTLQLDLSGWNPPPTCSGMNASGFSIGGHADTSSRPAWGLGDIDCGGSGGGQYGGGWLDGIGSLYGLSSDVYGGLGSGGVDSRGGYGLGAGGRPGAGGYGGGQGYAPIQCALASEFEGTGPGACEEEMEEQAGEGGKYGRYREMGDVSAYKGGMMGTWTRRVDGGQAQVFSTICLRLDARGMNVLCRRYFAGG
ncbi:LOW QUALITY PROTEIN: hypothetical protein CVT26_005707, partial [Gymnopilus dilepis]